MHNFSAGFSAGIPPTQTICWGLVYPGAIVLYIRVATENHHFLIVTLWLFNIAMGNEPFVDGLPLKNGDFPWLC